MGIFDIFKEKSTEIVDFNSEESLFYTELQKKLKIAAIRNKLTYNILSDKTINFKLTGIGQIGRVKIRGKTKRIQILKKAPRHNLDVLWLDVSGVDDMIMLIDKWIEYIKS